MKKIVCLLLSVLSFWSLFSLTVFAENDEDDSGAVQLLSVFGDSISTGFGLEDFDASDNSKAKNSFPNLLAKHYGLQFNESYFNDSRTGATSGQVLSDIKNADKERLKKSDMIIISVGANDIMSILEQTVFTAYSDSKSIFEQYGITIDFSSLKSIENTILAVWNDPSKKAVIDKIIAECTNEKCLNQYKDAVLKYLDNMKEMILYLREIGSEAELYFITPYNPTAAIPGNVLSDTLQKTLVDLKDGAVGISESQEFGYGVTVIDLLTDFQDRYYEMTQIASFDIHPTISGHRYIADKLIQTHVMNMRQREIELNQQRHRTAPYNDTIVYVIFVFACAAVIAILFHVFFTIRKGK